VERLNSRMTRRE